MPEERKPDKPAEPTSAEQSSLDSFRQHMTKDFLAGNPSPEVQAVIDAGHIPDIPAEW